MTALEKAIKSAGSAIKLASALGLTSMSISHWKHRDKGVVPPEYVLQIFRNTGVTPHELRPDLYPNPTDGLPQDQRA
ncbi:transcriptional regulator [Klebsiella aerogenes]